MGYQTRQGKLLLEYLRKQGSRHITVPEIAASLPERIGTATIYRQLEKLAGQGLVQKFQNDGGPACYQYIGELGGDCVSHFHLKCTVCGALIHLDCEELTKLVTHVYRDHGFRTDLTRSAFYGTCADCMARESGKN